MCGLPLPAGFRAGRSICGASLGSTHMLLCLRRLQVCREGRTGRHFRISMRGPAPGLPRRQAGSGVRERCPSGKAVPSVEWFRNIGFAGSVNFHRRMAIKLRLHHTALCPQSGLILSSTMPPALRDKY